MNFDYLPPGGLLPLPPPDGLPVVLGPFGGAEPPFALLLVIMFYFSYSSPLLLFVTSGD